MVLKNLKLDRDLVILDVETTGVDVEEDRIVQLAVTRLLIEGGAVHHELMLNPGIPIRDEAFRVHGIRDADVADLARFGERADEIWSMLSDADICGYNMLKFDIPLIQAEFRRCQHAELELEGIRLIDPMVIFAVLEPRTLIQALLFYCGAQHDTAHDATGDVSATVRVLLAQMGRYGKGIDELAAVTMGDRATLGNQILWNDEGHAALNFGKGRGKTLEDLARTDPGYLRWIVAKDFPRDVKELCRRALVGGEVRRPK